VKIALNRKTAPVPMSRNDSILGEYIKTQTIIHCFVEGVIHEFIFSSTIDGLVSI